MGIKGAIFDMDGTLLDSMKIWYNLGELFLIKKGKTPEEGLKDKLWDMSMKEAAYYMKNTYQLEGEMDVLVAQVYQLIEDFYRHEVEEKPGIRSVLDELKQAGVPMSVASATDTYLVEYALEHVGLRDYFQSVFCCRQVEAGKDSDKIYQVARESLGTKLDETWVFEDAVHAARTVKKAGFPLVAVKDFSEVHQDEMQKLADIYLESYDKWPGISHIRR